MNTKLALESVRTSLATTTQIFCRHHNFWNVLYGYQYYCWDMTTEKNDKRKLLSSSANGP